MSRTEQRQMVAMLGVMQHQFEDAVGGGGCLLVTIPGTDLKHVYSNELAEKIMRAIARALEQEKYRLFNKRY
jgi:hypothetical protein